MTLTKIRNLADLDRELDVHGLTLTPANKNGIRATGTNTTIPDHVRDWIVEHRQLVLDWLHFRCVRCAAEAAVFDSTGTPWCAEHMPVTDPAIRAAIVTLAQLGPLTLEEQAS